MESEANIAVFIFINGGLCKYSLTFMTEALLQLVWTDGRVTTEKQSPVEIYVILTFSRIDCDLLKGHKSFLY